MSSVLSMLTIIIFYSCSHREELIKSCSALSVIEPSSHCVTNLDQKELLVEPLTLLTKESFYCFRTPDTLTTGACTIECKRVDKKPLGWGLKSGISRYDDDCRRRCFAFTTFAQPAKKYEGPLFVHVREIPFSYGKLGGSIWMASIGMSQYIAMNPSLVCNKRVLELGSGVGLLGITISKLGGRVTMSEYGSVNGTVNGQIIVSDEKRLIPSAMLTNLQFNVNLNEQNDNMDVRHIDWYDYLPEKSTKRLDDDEHYDLIVGSDLINWEDDVEALIATLKHFMSRGAIGLLSTQTENRKGLPLFLQRLDEEFNSVETENYYVQHYDTHPMLLIKFAL